MKLGETITAQSTPDYDDWGPDSYWSAAQWIAWHKALKRAYGAEEANTIWSTAWFDQGFWDWPFSAYKYNNEFANYFKSQGISVGNPLSTIIVGSEGIIDSATTGAEKTIKATSSLLPILVTGLLFGAGYMIYQEVTTGSLKDLVNLTPAGAAKKALKSKN